MGASGRTGRVFTRFALAHGHEVTAFVHDPARFRMKAPRLTVAYGDARTPTDVAAAATDQEAIVSLLAPRGVDRRTGDIYLEGTRNLIAAADASGIRRLLVVSAEGAGVNPKELPPTYRYILKIPVVARLYPDIAAMELELMTRNDLDWTLVRPAVLTSERARGTYREAVGDVVPDGLRLSRADLAAFLLRVLERGEYVRQRVAVAH